MRVKIEEIKNHLTNAAVKYITKSEAAYFAKIWIETHLRKAPRMNPLEEVVADLKVWKTADNREIRTVVDKGGVMVIDFNGLAPSLKIGQLHDELEKRARQNGIAALGFHNSSGVVTLGAWSNGLAQKDMIGIAMFNGGTRCCVPHGGTQGFFGTSPMAYAIPSNDTPVIMDMAMTEIPFFEIDNAKKEGLPLKENVAVDQKGLPTTNAAEALSDEGVANLLPIGGGFKGYGLMLLVEVLTGSLIRSLMSDRQTPGWYPTEYGGLVIAIDVSNLTEVNRFKQSVSDLCSRIRLETPADGVDAVVIPGDRGFTKIADAMKAGEMELSDQLVEDLRQLSSPT